MNHLRLVTIEPMQKAKVLKRIPYLLLMWDETTCTMQRVRIETIRQARDIVQAQYLKTKTDHTFGQIVFVGDSRIDIFPKKLKRRKEQN